MMGVLELDYQQPIYGAPNQRFGVYKGLARKNITEITLESNFGPHVYELYRQPGYLCLWVPSHWTFAGQGHRRVAVTSYFLARILSGGYSGGELALLYRLQPGAHFMRCRWQMLNWLNAQPRLASEAKPV